MPLGEDDARFYDPVFQVVDWLTKIAIKPGDRVLDVGPGSKPFPRADACVDWLDEETLRELWRRCDVTGPGIVKCCDFAVDPLPFADKEFDFVYCRQTIEDMCSPFLLLEEMSRVGRAGYIETPSPVAELTRGVDGYGNAQLWRGYHHHRFFVWVDDDGVLNLVSKYPLVEHITFEEELLEDGLRRGPELWNSYYLWTNKIHWRHLQNPHDFVFLNYVPMLWQAAHESAKATEKFCQMVNAGLSAAA